jgi:hypothetical protein
MRPHSGDELARAERLHQVVVSAGRPSVDSRFLAGTCREQQHRDRPQRWIAANFFQQAKAIHRRHHDVGEDQIGGLAPGRCQRGDPITHRLDLVLGEQHPCDVLAHVGVVVGNEDSGLPSA